MPELPEVEATTEYYKQSMMTGFMQWFCRTGGKKKFSESDIEAKKEIAKFKAGDRNPYSWNMEFMSMRMAADTKRDLQLVESAH